MKREVLKVLAFIILTVLMVVMVSSNVKGQSSYQDEMIYFTPERVSNEYGTIGYLHLVAPEVLNMTDITGQSTNWYFVYEGYGEWKIFYDYTLIAYAYETMENIGFYKVEYIDYSHLDLSLPENREYTSRL